MLLAFLSTRTEIKLSYEPNSLEDRIQVFLEIEQELRVLFQVLASDGETGCRECVAVDQHLICLLKSPKPESFGKKPKVDTMKRSVAHAACR